MIEALILIGLIMIIIGLICLFTDANGSAFLLGIIGAYFLSGGIMMYQESYKPTAMDVYQEKTTLEITPITDNDIEYVRKDAFIEKMGNFLSEKYLIKTKEPLRWVSVRQIVEDFKKYMEG